MYTTIHIIYTFIDTKLFNIKIILLKNIQEICFNIVSLFIKLWKL